MRAEILLMAELYRTSRYFHDIKVVDTESSPLVVVPEEDTFYMQDAAGRRYIKHWLNQVPKDLQASLVT